jgi:hypothetical protein
MQTELVPVVTSLETVVTQSGLDPASAEALRLAFNPLFTAAADWSKRVNGLSVTDVSQKREMKLARESRLALKEIRCNADRQRKKLKEESLRRGKAIDGIYNVLEYLVTPLEEQLLAMEQFAERKEATRLDEQLVERQKALTYFGFPAMDTGALRTMADEDFQKLLADAQLMAEAKQREAERVELERLAKERAEAEERQRLAAENARLQAEAAAREAQLLAERQAAEQAAKVAAEAAAAEKREALAKAKEERLAAEARARAEAAAREEVARAAREAEAHAAKVRLDLARAEQDRLADLAAKEKAGREQAERELAAHRQSSVRVTVASTAPVQAAALPDATRVVIYGASDDLIEIEGALREEFNGGDDLAYLAFSDGTVLTVQYADDGCWRINRVATGTLAYTKVEADGADTKNYSDRVTLSGPPGELRWCVNGTGFVTSF